MGLVVFYENILAIQSNQDGSKKVSKKVEIQTKTSPTGVESHEFYVG